MRPRRRQRARAKRRASGACRGIGADPSLNRRGLSQLRRVFGSDEPPRLGGRGEAAAGPPARRATISLRIDRIQTRVLLRRPELVEGLEARVQLAGLVRAARPDDLLLEVPIDLEHVAELVGAREAEAAVRIRLDRVVADRIEPIRGLDLAAHLV